MELSQVGEASDALSFWTDFFRDAGIISSDVENYSLSFVNHRIKKNMLMELNKEYLSEMGITAMGDIIAILRQAKAVLSKPTLVPAESMQPTSTGSRHGLQPTSTGSKHGVQPTSTGSKYETPLEKLEKSLSHDQLLFDPNERSSSTGRRSTPASRMVDHYLANEPGARLMSDNVPLDLPRQLDFESVNRKNSVFDRLGCNGSFAQSAPALSRLGLQDKSTLLQVTVGRTSQNLSTSTAADLREVLKRPATTTCHDSGDTDSDDSECQYAGVLKKSHVPRKKNRRSAYKNSSQGSTVSSARSAGIFGINSKEISVSAKQRLGTKISLHKTL